MKKILNNEYTIDIYGKIYSIKRKKYLKEHISNGYKRVTIKNKSYTIHRLLALAFIEGFKASDQVNHKNGNKLDNRICNLEISNNSHNQTHSANVIGNRRYKKLTESQVEGAIEAFAMGLSTSDIAILAGIKQSALCRLLCNRFEIRNTPYGKKYKKLIVKGFKLHPRMKYHIAAINGAEEKK